MSTFNNSLKYAYDAPEKFGEMVLLGSAVRALGKGWRVLVVSDKRLKKSFLNLQKKLKRPEFLEVVTVSNFEDVFQTGKFDLVVMEKAFSNISPKSHVMVVDQSAVSEKYDLISKFRIQNLHEKGVTAVTGNGKGKTTTALGYAVSALVQNEKVAVIQWFKERKSGDLTWAINEHNFPDLLKDPSQFEFFPTGLGFYGSPQMDRVKGDHAYQQHREKAYAGLKLAKEFISERKYSYIVLDEFIDTVKEIAGNIEYPLIDLKDIQEFLEWAARQSVKIIVTGRKVTKDWEKYISDSIEITEVKHPWSTRSSGALSGLDF